MKILVRLPNWLGDIVMSSAFLNALAQHYPQAEIHIILKKELAGISELISIPHHLHVFSKSEYKGISGVYKFGKQLRTFQFDIFFCLPNSFSSALMGFATQAKQRIGYAYEGRSILLTKAYKQTIKQHRVLDYLSLLEQFTGDLINNPAVNLSSVPHDRAKKLILVNFNSEAISRRMPLLKGKKILVDLIEAFPNVEIGLIGSPKERDFVQSFIEDLDNKYVINYAGKTDFKMLINLMASASFVLSTDSGPAHLANSTGVPLLVLFGAGNEQNTAPFNQKNLNVIRLNELPCEPCVKNTCIYGLPKCLEELANSKIIDVCRNAI